MSLDVRHHPLAATELVDAQAWYEEQNRGLGDRYLVAFEATLKRVSRWPHAGTPVVVEDDGTVVRRKTRIGGFPWAAGYEVTVNTVIVLAVFHLHRRPDYWTTRQSVDRPGDLLAVHGRRRLVGEPELTMRSTVPRVE